MAKITLDGLDDVLNVLRRTAEGMTEVVDDMLTAGGEVANKAQQEAIYRHKHHRTYSMVDNVRYERPRLSLYSSGRYVSSYSRGADKFGTSNQKKAFILNYSFSHWFDEAYEKANPQITAEMRKVWDKWNPETGEGV